MFAKLKHVKHAVLLRRAHDSNHAITLCCNSVKSLALHKEVAAQNAVPGTFRFSRKSFNIQIHTRNILSPSSVPASV